MTIVPPFGYNAVVLRFLPPPAAIGSQGRPLLPRFLLGTIVFAVVYGEIRIRTGSVWPAILMHWVGNALANTLLIGYAGGEFVTLAPGMEWLGSFGVEGVVMIVLFGLLGGTLYLKRRGSENYK